MLYDPLASFRYRCHTAFPPEIDPNIVSLWNTSEFLSFIQHSHYDEYKRSWCMISLFYAANSVYSAQIAPVINAAPLNFPRLKAIAIDVAHFSRLNSKYGISGTPTVLLWVNGNAVARMELTDLSSEGLKKFVEYWTDLKMERISNGEDSPLVIEFNKTGDWFYFILALLTIFMACAYLVREQVLSREEIRRSLSILGLNSDSIIQYMSQM